MKTVIKSLSLMIAVFVVSCNSSNKWYLGEWTDGETTIVLTESSFVDSEGDAYPVEYSYNPELGTSIDFLDPDTKELTGSGGMILGYDVTLDDEKQEIVLTEAWHMYWESRYHKKAIESVDATLKEIEDYLDGEYSRKEYKQIAAALKDGKITSDELSDKLFTKMILSDDGALFSEYGSADVKRKTKPLILAYDNLLYGDYSKKEYKEMADALRDEKITSGELSEKLLSKIARNGDDALIRQFGSKGTITQLDELRSKTDLKKTEVENGSSISSGSKEQKVEKENTSFRRVDDVFNYLNKHTFKSSNGTTLSIRPSGISVSGRLATNAVRVSLNDEYSAIVIANTPVGETVRFIVNCSTGQIADLGPGGDYYYEQ